MAAGSDFYFNESGDIILSTSGDIATVDTDFRDVVQQAYVRVMTDQGDFLLYPALGASLSQLYGMPQSPATGALGVKLIQQALNTAQGFVGATNVQVKAVPIDQQVIRFDIFIASGSLQQIKLSVQQSLSLTQ